MQLAHRTFRADLPPLAIGILIFAALSITCAVTSEGFLEADGCMHYLYARFAFSDPHYFVNIWGRPFKTALYAIPAHLFGLIGVRVTSLIVAISIAVVTYTIARGEKYRLPALAAIFCFAQPMFFLHSASELTELPFALLLSLGFLAYQRKCFFWMTLVMALTPLSRPEGFAFLPLVAIALVVHRKWHWLPLLAAPLVAWDYAGWVLFGRPNYPWYLWLKHEWPYAAESVYQSGSPWHFLGLLPAVTGPLVFPALLFSLPFRWSAVAKTGPAHNAPRLWDWTGKIILLIPLLILAGHSYLYWRGKMASSGELRYMLTVAPFWALLIARGWERVWMRLNWRWPHLIAGICALAPIVINLKFELPYGKVFGYKVLPLVLQQDWNEARTLTEWLKNERLHIPGRKVAAAHPAIYYFLDINPSGPQSVQWKRDSLMHTPPANTTLVWDATYARFNADASRIITLEDLQKSDWKWTGVSLEGATIYEDGKFPEIGRHRLPGWIIADSPVQTDSDSDKANH